MRGLILLFLCVLGYIALINGFPTLKQSPGYLEVETVSSVFSLNGSVFTMSAKLSRRLSRPITIDMVNYYEEAFWRYKGQQPTFYPHNFTFPFNNPWTLTADTNGPGGSLTITQQTRFGYDQSCLFIATYYATSKPTWWTLHGINVSLLPSDVKFSYAVQNCSIINILSKINSVPAENIVVLGRKGGALFVTSFITDGLRLPDFKSVGMDHPISTEDWWRAQCISYNETATGQQLAPLRGIWPGLNFSQELVIAFPLGLDGEFVNMKLKYAMWSWSDNQFTFPAVRVSLDLTEFTTLPDGSRQLASRMIINQEYFVDAEYDPTISLLFTTEDSSAPLSETQLAETNMASIVGAVAGTLVGVAIIGLIAAVIAVPSFRHKVLPFSMRRVPSAPQSDENDADVQQNNEAHASVRDQKAAKDSWIQGNTHRTPVKNTF